MDNKKTEMKKKSENKENKKIKKKITKQVEKETKKKVVKKTVKKNMPEVVSKLKEEVSSNTPFLENVEKIREKRNKKMVGKLELIVIVAFSIIMLLLLCNRTFFRNNYKTSKINIDIPLLMFFSSDDGNKLVLKTLRKSEYVRDYFNDKLKNMTFYNCNGYSFYYDENNFYAIYDIKIEKDFVVKTTTIEYASGSADCLCNANAIGKKAEKICLR